MGAVLSCPCRLLGLKKGQILSNNEGKGPLPHLEGKAFKSFVDSSTATTSAGAQIPALLAHQNLPLVRGASIKGVTTTTINAQQATMDTQPFSISASHAGTAVARARPSIILHQQYQTPMLGTFPQVIIRQIFSHLLTSSEPLILPPGDHQSTQDSKNLQISLLRVNREYLHIGLHILYGANTITAPSPTASFNFDAQLAALPGKHRLLIRSVKLEINWGDELWTKFPLVAIQLGQLPLKNLTISIINAPTEGPRRDLGLANAMLVAERKMMKGLVEDLRSLRMFVLTGFRDAEFAAMLEASVNNGKH